INLLPLPIPLPAPFIPNPAPVGHIPIAYCDLPLNSERKSNSRKTEPMKTKYLLLGIGALFAVIGVWAGRIVWRINHQLITLDVRNAPLAEVLRKIERQTWKKIRVEKNFDVCITLHVKNKPLSYVLDRIGEQAGARWSTLYAVYNSSSAVKALD